MPLDRILFYYGRIKYLDIVPSMQESELQEQAGMCQKCSSVNIFYRCKNFGALGLFSQI